MLLLDSLLVVPYALILTILLYRKPDFNKTKDKVMVLLILSFAVPLFHHLFYLFFGSGLESLLRLQVVFWTMLFASLLSFIYRKKTFFYALFSVPLSSVLVFLVVESFVLSFTALVSLIVLAEVLIYVALNGSFASRIMASLGLMSSFAFIYFLYPVPGGPFIGRIVYLGGAFFLPATFFVVYRLPLKDLELVHNPSVKYIFYAFLSLLLVMLSGTFIGAIQPIFLFGGLLSALTLFAISSSPEKLDEIVQFLTSGFIIASCIWIFTTLFEMTFQEKLIVFHFRLNLLEFAVLLLINLVGVSIIKRKKGI